jgi:death on curing protein
MINLEHVLAIHDELIDRFGGAKGVRDIPILESAIYRAFQTFDGIELYPEAVDKAAAIFESIITNHPFVDGNKRTAYVFMRLMLRENKSDINATEDDKYTFVISAASGESNYEEIRAWIKNKLVPLG